MSEKKTVEMMYSELTEQQKNEPMPYYRHQIELARQGLNTKRWFVFSIVLLALLIATNAFWIIKDMQYQDEVWTYEIQQDSGEGGTNTYTGNTVRFVGGDDNGETDNKDYSQAENAETGK